MSSGNVLLGVIAGLAAGAVIGILFAPAKGKDTRKKITKKSEDLMDDIKEKFDDVLESISEKYQEVKEEVSDIKEKAKS